MKKIITLLLVALVAAACASGDDELPGEAVCIPAETENPAPEYLGLDEAEANALAEEQELDIREVGRDGECFPTTMDYREDRINVEYVDGIVVGAARF